MRHPLLLIGWLLLDVALFVAAYALAYFLRVGFLLSSDFPFLPFLTVAAAAAPAWLLVLVTTRVFALTRSQGSPRNGAYIVYACVVGTAIFALGYYFAYGLFFSRMLLVLALGFSTVFTWAAHILVERVMRRVLRRDPPAFPTLVVGVTRESASLVRLLNARRSPLKPAAILDGRGAKEKEIDGVPVEGKLHKLEETLERHRITHLIQCSDLEQSINLLSACRQRGITYLLLPSVLGIIGGDERVEMLEGQPVTVVHPRRSWLNQFFA